MDTERQAKILKVARYIIANKATIAVTANHFGLSVSSIKKYINDPDKLKSIDLEIYKEVKKVQNELENIGHYIGGKNGTREPKYTEFESLEIAEVMISESLTIAQAAEKFGMAKSTLYERIRAIKDDCIQNELNLLLESNKERFGVQK